MTNEEMQRMLEMIINRQEIFSDNMEKAEARMNRLESAFVGLFGIVTETVKAQKELTESQKELAASQKELVESQKELAESLKHTDERLSALINTVERYISDGRNGQSRG